LIHQSAVAVPRVTLQEGNWNRSNFSWVTPRCRRRNATLAANRNSVTPLTTISGWKACEEIFTRTRLLDNNDLGTVNIVISLVSGHRTAVRLEAGRQFVCPAIPLRVSCQNGSQL